jgi:hypothetical protein
MSAEHEIFKLKMFNGKNNFLWMDENIFIHEEVVMTSWHANLNHITFTLTINAVK